MEFLRAVMQIPLPVLLAAAATLGYLLWPSEDERSAHVRPGFDVGSQHTTVSLSGRF